MALFVQYFWLSLPLFVLVLVGFALGHLPFWQPRWTQFASRGVFALLLPALLFQTMSDRSQLPPVDARLLLAFFGGCLVVFGMARWIGRRLFGLNGVQGSVFALGAVFSNNVLLGLPLARSAFGAAALPAVALVIVFNALTLWTLVSVSIEWARHGSVSLRGFARTALGVLTNPIVLAILAGSAFGVSGLQLPPLMAAGLTGLARLAAPAALLVLGMGLAEYGLGDSWRTALTICGLKLIAHPLLVWLLAEALQLPELETKAVVLLASMSVGANVYLMAVQFEVLQAEIAASLVASTALAAFTTPALLALLG
jgi:malonate transporter and related proteins